MSADGSVTVPALLQVSRFSIHKLGVGERPPQFVIVGFDGSGDVDQLKEWARITQQVGGNVSYFLSGVFLLERSQLSRYHPPQHAAGASSIGYAKSQDPIPAVAALLSAAWLAGNDIGLHFNGHFCGANGVNNWTRSDWVSEIRQFNSFVDHWRSNNSLSGAPMAFSSADVVGDRSPCLEGKRPALLGALSQMHYRYDTSDTGLLRWPRKTLNGLWEFPLQTIQWTGPNPGPELAMDYNLWYRYNHAAPITTDAQRQIVSNGVYNSYLTAFNATYNGNRAPLFLGNHMNYWGCNRAYTDCNSAGTLTGDTPLQHNGPFVDGLQRSYLAMCGRPNVQCVSYRQMADWLDAQDPATVRQLQSLQPVVG